MTESKKKDKIEKEPAVLEGITPKSPEEAKAELEHFFAQLEGHFKDVPEAEIARGAKKMKDFIEGKINWAELFNFTPEMLFQMAEYGFTQFKNGRYPDAERVFKVLTVLEWNNPYYHSVMGSILQRQKRYGEAIAEYSQALDLDPKDIVSLANRGEIYMQHGLMDDAKADFKKAIELDKAGDDKFAKRARMLVKQMEKIQRGEKE